MINKITFGQELSRNILTPITLEEIRRPGSTISSIPAVTVNKDSFKPSANSEQPKSNTWKWVAGLTAVALVVYAAVKHRGKIATVKENVTMPIQKVIKEAFYQKSIAATSTAGAASLATASKGSETVPIKKIIKEAFYDKSMAVKNKAEALVAPAKVVAEVVQNTQTATKSLGQSIKDAFYQKTISR